MRWLYLALLVGCGARSGLEVWPDDRVDGGAPRTDASFDARASDARPMDASIDTPSPIAHHMAGHLALAGSLFDRVGLSINVPVILDQSGTAFAGVGPSGTTAGDPRIGARVRLYGQPYGALSLMTLGLMRGYWSGELGFYGATSTEWAQFTVGSRSVLAHFLRALFA